MPPAVAIPSFAFTVDSMALSPPAAGGGSNGGGDSAVSDAQESALYIAQAAFMPAIFNDGGVVARCSYLVDFGLLPGWSTIGFGQEIFLVNLGGVAANQPLITATTITGPLPFGVAEYNTNLTQNGITNVARWIVRVS